MTGAPPNDSAAPPRKEAGARQVSSTRHGARMRVCYIVESGTDVRTVEGMAERFDFTLVARRMLDAVEVSQPPARAVDTIVGPGSRLRFGTFIARYLVRNRNAFDYVLAQGYGLGALVANLAGRVTKVPTAMVIVSPVEAYYRCRLSNPHAGKVYRRHELVIIQLLARLNARFGRRYLVPSSHLGDTVRGHGSAGAIDLVAIYGVDTQIFRPRTESLESLRMRRGLPGSGQVIFFSSRIAPEKDSRAMLAAFAELVGRGRDLWLLHRSGGFQAFAQEAARMGIANRVIASDAVHPHRELPIDYQASDICVQASREEGLGFSPLEAMACGVPVIASAVGGLRETVIEGSTGWTYPVGDTPALVRAIEAVLDNPEEARRRAEIARSMVRERFERRMVFDRLEAVLENDLAQRRSAT